MLSLHKRDVQISPNLSQLRQAGAPENHLLAVRANAHQTPEFLCHRLILRHPPGWQLGSAASNAIDFSRLAGPLVFRPARLEKGCQFTAKDQGGALGITRWQSSLNPGAHGILVRAKQARNLFHRIAQMDLHKAVIGAALAHGVAVLRHSFPGGFQLRHQLSNLAVRLACNPGSVQCCHLVSGPAHGSSAQAYRFGEHSLVNAQVDRAARKAGCRFYLDPSLIPLFSSNLAAKTGIHPTMFAAVDRFSQMQLQPSSDFNL